MRFIKKGQPDTIIYNSQIVVPNISAKAYEYTIHGKSVIEWVMERYQVKTDLASNIKNDPNDWAKKIGNPRYILDLLLSMINVSMQTVDVISSLPRLSFETDSAEISEIQEHNWVLATSQIGDIPVGTPGTVVHIYENKKGYEVEFIVNHSIIVETALPNQIEKKQ